MRILVIQEATRECIDGIQLRLFRPGIQYDVGPTLAALFVVEGWAVPVPSEEPAVVIPPSDVAPAAGTLSNLIRETFPPYYDAASSADRRRHPRQRRARRK